MIERAVVGRQARRCCSRVARLHPEQFPTAGELARPLSIAQEAEVADAVKPVGQDMDQEAANEFVGGELASALVVGFQVIDEVRGWAWREAKPTERFNPAQTRIEVAIGSAG